MIMAYRLTQAMHTAVAAGLAGPARLRAHGARRAGRALGVHTRRHSSGSARAGEHRRRAV
jgi:hypothetical protein